MTRRTERICYLTLLVILSGFILFDGFDRGWFPGLRTAPSPKPPASFHESPSPPTPLTEARVSRSDSPAVVADEEPSVSWIPLQYPPVDKEDSTEPDEAPVTLHETSAGPVDLTPRASPEEVEAFYEGLARRKSQPPRRDVRYHDWELAGGRKPDWWIAQTWNNRLRFENYRNPGPLYRSSYVDPFGNRHVSFEDRSGRMDVFQTWGRERVYLTPK